MYALLMANLLYLTVGLILLIIVNSLFLKEEAQFLKIKEQSFLPSFDFSIIFVVILFILQILPNALLKEVWLVISIGLMYYLVMKMYHLKWKEALQFYSIWLTFIILLALFLTKMANS